MLREARKSCTERVRQIPCYFPSIPAVDSDGMGRWGGGGGLCPSEQGVFFRVETATQITTKMFSFFLQVFWHHCTKIKLNCLTKFGIKY